MMFCPVMYHAALKHTFDDPAVFSSLYVSPTQFHSNLPSLLTPELNKKYAWGIDLNAHLPYAYAFLKKKKSYKLGRTIISYAGTTFAKLLKAAAIILGDMQPIAFPEVLGLDPSPIKWKSLHNFLTECPAENDLHI